MNPHQKPQEDVVGQEDIEAAERWKGVWGSFADRLPAEDLAYALARHRLLGYEAGRRDMREAAPSEDWLAEALDDSLDMDWTGRVGAQAIIREWDRRYVD